MKSVIRYVLATATMVLMAQGAFAALSPEYANFGKGAMQFLMTKDELAKWNTITTDQDAKAFIDLFWLRRDPSPGTPANELKDWIEQHIKLADERFGYRKTPGSMTDRGKLLVVLGQPTENVKSEKIQSVAPTASGVTDEDAGMGTSPTAPRTSIKQTFTFEPAKMQFKPVAAAIGPDTLQFVFIDSTGSGDFRLDRPRKGPNYDAIYEKAAAAYVVQPNASLTQTTTTTTTTTTTVTKGTPAGAATPGTLKTASLQTAVDDLKAGKSTATKNGMIAYAEFVSPTGDYFVPATLYIPKSAGITADSVDTFFGVVTDSTGAQVYAFEEPAKLQPTKNDFFADKTLNNVSTGKYNVVLGLAKAGAPVVLVSKSLDLTSVAKDAVGHSALILSNNVFETTEAAPVKSPFAFGKLKIVPKADMNFSNKDELTYFIELHNPSVDPATNLPKLQVKLELSGGKLTRPITAPLSEAAALPLSGAVGPGQYAVISSIPLGEMTKPLDPGDYTLKVRLIDSISKQTYNLEQSFKIGS